MPLLTKSLNRRNRYDRKDSLELGDSAEARFTASARQNGWDVARAESRQDIDEHWDVIIRRGSEIYRVDVKAMKRVARSDRAAQADWIWIELHGVRENELGWLYGGKADLIAFERPESFALVARAELIALVERTVDFRKRVFSPALAKYKIYQRRGRPDQLSLIEASQLDPIQWSEWKKETE
jgi:hypothetical protein